MASVGTSATAGHFDEIFHLSGRSGTEQSNRYETRTSGPHGSPANRSEVRDPVSARSAVTVWVAACDRGNGRHYNNSWNVQRGYLVGASSRGSARLYLKSDKTVRASGRVCSWSGNLSLILLLPLSSTAGQFVFTFLRSIYVIVIIIPRITIHTHVLLTAKYPSKYSTRAI